MLKGECFGWDHHTFLYIFATIAIAISPLANCQGTTLQTALPNCPDKCGDVVVPYPFGIGDRFHYNHPEDGLYYKLSCNDDGKLIYGRDLKVKKITLKGEFQVLDDNAFACYNSTGYPINRTRNWINIERFALSTTRNIAGAIGCQALGYFSGTVRKNSSLENGFLSGCVTACTNQTNVEDKCSGIGCCLATIPDGLTNITKRAQSIDYHTDEQQFNSCSFSFVVANDSEAENGLPFSIRSILAQNVSFFEESSNLVYPMVYDWSIGTKDCASAVKAGESLLCKENTICLDGERLPGQLWGYRCQCKEGFEGNPYLNGCQDINECMNKTLNTCEKPEYCVNYPGTYNCTCPKGFHGKGRANDTCTSINTASLKKLLLGIKVIVGVGSGIIVSLLCCFWFHWQRGNKKLQRMETYFHQNGGHILKQKLSGREVHVGNMVTMFTVEELKKATDNYSEDSMIGRGGFGMVYKGTLAIKDMSPNNQVVAIKKSIRVDSAQVEQFINEVVALSQINNRNVVKLLGCCLETEVPLLVYEYISNGTLHDHLHGEGKITSLLSWDVRLRIAAEVAEVLAYLHTTISIPIIHRDIKSANILLDDNYIAKVADFGASKFAPIDQEQLGTIVQGTCGYLDPEYMQTGELTDKSDVYSFGVVLVELLTRRKAISYAKSETERSLAICFLRKLKEDRLIEILDDKIMSDKTIEQLKEVANLSRRCLKLKGDDRPTMKEVARELDRIREMGNHPWLSNNSILLQEESEYLLDETHAFNTGFGNEGVSDSLNSQSRVVELVPTNDGR